MPKSDQEIEKSIKCQGWLRQYEPDTILNKVTGYVVDSESVGLLLLLLLLCFVCFSFCIHGGSLGREETVLKATWVNNISACLFRVILGNKCGCN